VGGCDVLLAVIGKEWLVIGRPAPAKAQTFRPKPDRLLRGIDQLLRR
jgi:hypothetical protein